MAKSIAVFVQSTSQQMRYFAHVAKENTE
jgi:hypothetical protein